MHIRKRVADFQEVKMWEEKDPPLLQRSSGAKAEPVFPGVFDESAWGYGHLYLPGGKRVWCHYEEARHLAAEASVKLVFFDRLAGYTGVAVSG